MGRSRNNNRNPIPTHVRVRMFRQRQKLKEMRQQQLANQLSDIIANESIDTNISTNSDSDSGLNKKLIDWVNAFVIPKTAVDSLLSILHPYFDSLPKCSKTLLKTPLDVDIKENAGGEMWYYGLAKCLEKIFVTLDRDIQISLNFNIDGLQVYNSSKVSFWPIVANIYGTHRIYIAVVIHMFSFAEFLDVFVAYAHFIFVVVVLIREDSEEKNYAND